MKAFKPVDYSDKANRLYTVRRPMYRMLYAKGMKVTITEFRRNLFRLVDRVIAGESVEFIHQGTTIRLVIPEGGRPSKLDRLTPRQIANPRMTAKEHQAAKRKLQSEMWTQIEKDWAEI